MKNGRALLALAAISGAVAVLLGAFGAHYLKQRIPEHIDTFHTAVLYQMIHTLALAALGLMLNQRFAMRLRWSGILFITGIILFSGSLYILSTASLWTDPERLRWLGPLTPIGGLSFIAGWLLMAIHFFIVKNDE